MDPKMIGEVGGDLLFTKIARPHKALMLSFGPSLFQDIDKGALIVCDNVLLEKLQYTVTRAVEDGTFHRCGQRGGCGGYRGGYRGGRSSHRGTSRGPTIVQSGIHYHTW